ncbi:MAG: 4Fe-4S ferredoxin [Proteobacteria bacterium]|nr:4Fe-4S ferredoxin [Pseudomonadota bacterium]
MMPSNVYFRLREFLDNLPGGFPATEDGVEIRILKKLFTVEQAEVCLHLTAMPSSARTIATKLNRHKETTAKILEDMAMKGLIFRMRSDNSAFYAAASFIVGIFEFNLNTIDREFSEMMAEYLPHIAKQWSTIDTKQLRVIPVGSSIEAKSEIATYDKIYDLIQDVKLISVSDCICAKEKNLLGHRCKRPIERCVQFDTLARYFIDNRMARQIDVFELMNLLKMGEDNELVLSPMNVQKITGFCMCCGCCCTFLNIVKMSGCPASQIQSSFSAEINQDICMSCGTCDERCQMDAIGEGDAAYQIDKEICIGCGLCIKTCPENAIALIEKSGDNRPPPENLIDMNLKISKERGLI